MTPLWTPSRQMRCDHCRQKASCNSFSTCIHRRNCHDCYAELQWAAMVEAQCAMSSSWSIGRQSWSRSCCMLCLRVRPCCLRPGTQQILEQLLAMLLTGLAAWSATRRSTSRAPAASSCERRLRAWRRHSLKRLRRYSVVCSRERNLPRSLGCAAWQAKSSKHRQEIASQLGYCPMWPSGAATSQTRRGSAECSTEFAVHMAARSARRIA
mmetsp:Transcript_43533/g.124504  ORF Transcript_43533/g.124504 Transcript_43533/m.124504 type:complete len:210 (+) Transcript_43533:1021-1650(+)